MAAVLIQIATELALKAAFVREDGLLSIVHGDDSRRTQAEIVARIERNVSVNTFKFDHLKQRARDNGRFLLVEDDWGVVDTFQTMRNRLVHIDFNFHPDDLYDIKWDLLHMLVHVVVRLLHVSDSDMSTDSFRTLLGDRFLKLLDWPPYEDRLRRWANVPTPLDCPACCGQWFDTRELRCLRCGFEYDVISAGVATCGECALSNSVIFDKLNPQSDGNHLGKCLSCGWCGFVTP